MNVTGTNTSRVVALIGSSMYWRDILSDILPKGSNGLVLVFENPCAPSFTYQINGPETVYLGRGDNHDIQYNIMLQASSLLDLKMYAVSKSRYTGAPLNQEYCPMTINVYPSTTMESEYVTNDPIIYALIAVLIFAFTSIVFVIYDYKVERRQKVVLNSAVKSTAIVSSLYPAHIRDKLLADDDDKPKEKDNKKDHHGKDHNTVTIGTVSSGTISGGGNGGSGGNGGRYGLGDFMSGMPGGNDFGIKSFLDNDGNPAVCVDKTEEENFLAVPQPIADLYKDTTVMFADISGFSTWSLNRNPEHIFILLEVLYGAFDTIAEKRNILKVESIGESYVAVIGIPEYRRNHALVMAKFAADLLTKMTELTQRLVITLGRETTSLHLAVGLNSGPITAGVIRSSKSRFQLFGDTVMVAEQLKSTASPGCIQCSQETADLLVSAGKGSWLVKRVNLVLTRGTGVVSMYWVQPPQYKPASISPSSLSADSEASSTQNGNGGVGITSYSSTPRVRSTTPTTTSSLSTLTTTPQQQTTTSSSLLDTLKDQPQHSPTVISGVATPPSPYSVSAYYNADKTNQITNTPSSKNRMTPELTAKMNSSTSSGIGPEITRPRSGAAGSRSSGSAQSNPLNGSFSNFSLGDGGSRDHDRPVVQLIESPRKNNLQQQRQQQPTPPMSTSPTKRPTTLGGIPLQEPGGIPLPPLSSTAGRIPDQSSMYNTNPMSPVKVNNRINDFSGNYNSFNRVDIGYGTNNGTQSSLSLPHQVYHNSHYIHPTSQQQQHYTYAEREYYQQQQPQSTLPTPLAAAAPVADDNLRAWIHKDINNEYQGRSNEYNSNSYPMSNNHPTAYNNNNNTNIISAQGQDYYPDSRSEYERECERNLRQQQYYQDYGTPY